MFPWNMLFPNLKNGQKNGFPSFKADDIEQYVQNIIDSALHAQNHGQSNTTSDTNSDDTQANEGVPLNIYETFDFIFLRLEIDEEEVKNTKISHTSHSISISTGFSDERHTIPLPSPVRKKGTYAQYKEGMLEIRLLKLKEIEYTEIDIIRRK
ncbi:hypothetical protein WAK64_17580 [Bacillus spongiae]|uniref:Hsp20/alpha crystallin family protein n=1 Tax=Bacillus spongiae TaxID=2683610 RepID=A0ABU8HIA8_9BACI